MTRLRLRNKFLRFRSDENEKAYHIMSNAIVVLSSLEMQKKSHYSNLDIKDVNDNKNVWKIVKPLFSEKMTANENITQVGNNNIISSDSEIAEKLNTFFSNVVDELNIKVKHFLCHQKRFVCHVSNINDPVKRAIQKCKNHPSIQMIKETF